MSRFDGARRRIAIFVPTMEGGGAEAVMAILANGFVASGHDVDLLLVAARGPNMAQLDPAVRILELGGRGVMGAIPSLIRYLRRTPPAVLMSAMSHTNVAALIAQLLSFRDVRLVISERFSIAAKYDLYDSPRERVLRLLMRLLYKRASAVIAVAKQLADDLVDLLHLERNRIFVLPNPVVSPTLLEGSFREPDVSWWPLGGDGPLILAAGRLSAVKDHAMLIRAFARLRDGRSARLLILGEGEARPELEALVRNLGLNGQVLLPGYVSNPAAFMRRADLFVLSSKLEGLPGVLVQAMACGVPVVSTDCPTGPREILEDGRWGRLVPVGDETALVEAMAATLDERSHPDVAERAQAFREDRAVAAYLDVLLDRGSSARA